MSLFSMSLCLVVSVQSAQREPPPSSIIDLSNWRLTLPIDTPAPLAPDEIRQPDLATFVDSRYFFVHKGHRAIAFRAHCGGYPTKGSSYPRCELREMVEEGATRASWDTDGDVIHSMSLRAAITATPTVKKHVVCAQIHNAEDDLLMIRLEGTKLFIERNNVDRVMLERNYQLGTPFDLKVQAGEGTVAVWYDGQLRMSWNVISKGCYFKAGCYTQSNLSRGDKEDSIGEVLIYQLEVHEH